MSYREAKFMAAMAMAYTLSNDVYGIDRVPKEKRPYSTDGMKCAQCTKFGTSRCKCTFATEKSPACSAMTVK